MLFCKLNEILHRDFRKNSSKLYKNYSVFFYEKKKQPDGLTFNSSVQPVEIGECKRHGTKVHDDFADVSRVAIAATCHEDAGVAAPDVAAAGVVHGEIDGGVQRTLDRPLDARMQQPPLLSQLLDLPREDVVRLAHLAHEHRVILDRRRQVRPTL